MFEKFQGVIKNLTTLSRKSRITSSSEKQLDYFDVPMAWENVLSIFDKEIGRVEQSLLQAKPFLTEDKISQVQLLISEARQSLGNFNSNIHPQTEAEVRDLAKIVYQEQKRLGLYELDRALLQIVTANEQ